MTDRRRWHLYERKAAAHDARVSSGGSGSAEVSFHFIVPSREDVHEVMGEAVAAGAGVVREAAAVQCGASAQRPGRLSQEGRVRLLPGGMPVA